MLVWNLGNAGDSRAVLCQKGKAVPLSFDHKPSDPGELQRITNAGGWVDACRVNGYLALSRAIGDFIFKNSELLKPEEQIVTGFFEDLTTLAVVVLFQRCQMS